jgi:hypothetical protein
MYSPHFVGDNQQGITHIFNYAASFNNPVSMSNTNPLILTSLLRRGELLSDVTSAFTLV